MDILDGRLLLRVSVLIPPTDDPEPDEPEDSPVETFLRWWRDEARRRHAPRPSFTGRERSIIARLLRTHGPDRLRKLAVSFWRWYATPITEGTEADQIVLFTRRIKDVERDLQQMTA